MQENRLPQGQTETNEFSRYGLLQYAKRTHLLCSTLNIEVTGKVTHKIKITQETLEELPRVKQTSDFHCITTWSKRGLNWSGYSFKEFYEKIIKEKAIPKGKIKYVVFRSQDNYRTFFLLEDLLASDVLLADNLAGKPLTWQHGAPIRLVAPAHYGFRSAKHLSTIELRHNLDGYKSPSMHWTEHPRARVAYEERGRFLPAVFYRYLFKAFIPAVRWWYKKAEKNA